MENLIKSYITTKKSYITMKEKMTRFVSSKLVENTH